jgi:hypothetical protein
MLGFGPSVCVADEGPKGKPNILLIVADGGHEPLCPAKSASVI